MEKAVRPMAINIGNGVSSPSHQQVMAAQRETRAEKTKEKQLKTGESYYTFVKTTILGLGSAADEAALLQTNSFEVVGGLSDAEAMLLTPVRSADRAFKVQTWMVRMMTARLQAGGLQIPPPLLSRTYQVLSDGTAAAAQARKISHVEFPFALRQLLAVLLGVFSILAPMCIAAFIDSTPLVAAVSFFVLLGYIALNETARELENPFGLDANDLTVTQYQKDLNHKLASLVDLTIPELGYVQHQDYTRHHLTHSYDKYERRSSNASLHPPPTAWASAEPAQPLETPGREPI